MITNEVDILLNNIVEDMQSADVLIDSLHSIGYTYNFELVGNKLLCLQTQLFYFPRDFEVNDVYFFDQAPMGLDGYYLYALGDSSGPVGIFTAYPVQDIPTRRS